MPDFRTVTPDFTTSPQITPDTMAEVAALGFHMVINNRPDQEVPDQPSNAIMSRAAQAAGLDYHHIPVRGVASPDQVLTMRSLLDQAQGPVLAFCRSGTRSITLWAMAERLAGRPKPELVSLAARAGYDLSGLA